MVDKHSHKNLLLGSQYNGTVAAQRVLDARSPNWVAQPTKKRVPDDEDDEDSASSWEIAEQVHNFRMAVANTNDPLPGKGLIPLTSQGAEHYGAPALAHSFAGRPLQILTRARNPRDGDLWGMGANYDGQLGLAEGSKMDRASATRQVFLKGGQLRSLAAGGAHSLILLEDGTVLAAGLNTFGQLGDGTRLTRRALTRASEVEEGVVEVAAGGLHSLALLESGQVVAWGSNSSSQLGPCRQPMSDPELREAFNLPDASAETLDVLRAALSEDEETGAKDGSGGAPAALLLKLNTLLSGVLLPHVARGGRKAWYRKAAATFGCPTPVPISGGDLNDERVVAIAAGNSVSLAIDHSGQLYQWGGETGAWPRRVEGIGARAVEVVAGEAHCVVRCDDGSLWTWEVSRESGRTGEGPRARGVPLPSRCVAVAAGGNTTMALVESEAGSYVWEWNTTSDSPNLISDLPSHTPKEGVGGMVGVAVGAHGARYVLLRGGGVMAWGDNARGQCGAGDKLIGKPLKIPKVVKFLERGVTALAAGDRHTLAITRELDQETPRGAMHDA